MGDVLERACERTLPVQAHSIIDSNDNLLHVVYGADCDVNSEHLKNEFMEILNMKRPSCTKLLGASNYRSMNHGR